MRNDSGGPEVAQSQVALSQSAPRIREAEFTDYEAVAALQRRHGLTTRLFPAWSGLWCGNPAYGGSGRAPIGWVLDAGGAVAGFLGIVPLMYSLNGRAIRAATPYSWVVDREHRGYSMALLSKFVRQPGVDLIVCATVNAAAEAVYRTFQFSRPASGAWDRAELWIAGHRGFADSVMRAVTARAWSRPLAAPLSAALALHDALKSAPRADAGSFEQCSEFDARFDEFWDALQEQNPGVLLAVRDRETLAWHFQFAEPRPLLLAATRAGRIVAYAVFDRYDNPALGLKRMRLVDFQSLRGSEALVRPALGCALEQCRSEGVHVLEIAGCWLSRLGVPGTAAPYRRKLASWSFYYRARDKSLCERLADAAAWFPTAYDGDASL